MLREIQLAYAAGWAVGENISTVLVTGWLKSRAHPKVRSRLARMVQTDITSEPAKLENSWERFEIAPELSATILALPLPSAEEQLLARCVFPEGDADG